MTEPAQNKENILPFLLKNSYALCLRYIPLHPVRHKREEWYK